MREFWNNLWEINQRILKYEIEVEIWKYAKCIETQMSKVPLYFSSN